MNEELGLWGWVALPGENRGIVVEAFSLPQESIQVNTVFDGEAVDPGNQMSMSPVGMLRVFRAGRLRKSVHCPSFDYWSAPWPLICSVRLTLLGCNMAWLPGLSQALHTCKIVL